MIWASFLVFLAACTTKVEDTGFCSDAPVVTWESHGDALLTRWCQPCHASDAADRNDAPASVTFDTEEDALRWADAILQATTGDDPIMPPGNPLVEEDQYVLELWLECDEG